MVTHMVTSYGNTHMVTSYSNNHMVTSYDNTHMVTSYGNDHMWQSRVEIESYSVVYFDRIVAFKAPYC